MEGAASSFGAAGFGISFSTGAGLGAAFLTSGWLAAAAGFLIFLSASAS